MLIKFIWRTNGIFIAEDSLDYIVAREAFIANESLKNHISG